MTQKTLRKQTLKNGQDPRPANQVKKKPRPFDAITSAELEVKKWPLKWLVNGIFVKNQPGVIGGVQKSLKTSIAMDLSISLGSQEPFLGEFQVPKKLRVATFSGETVRGSFRQNAQRICEGRGLSLSDCDVMWSFKLPRLSVPSDLTKLQNFLRDEGVQVVIVDPLYLCLGVSGNGVANLFETGPLLRDFSSSCLGAGATPILVHHTTKTSDQRRQTARQKSTDKGGKPTSVAASLGDLAYSGLGEFARQWLLISRNTEFDPSSGRSDLTLTVGGSAGQAGQWDVIVNEGTMNTKFAGRKWQVSFRDTELDDLEDDDDFLNF